MEEPNNDNGDIDLSSGPLGEALLAGDVPENQAALAMGPIMATSFCTAFSDMSLILPNRFSHHARRLKTILLVIVLTVASTAIVARQSGTVYHQHKPGLRARTAVSLESSISPTPLLSGTKETYSGFDLKEEPTKIVGNSRFFQSRHEELHLARLNRVLLMFLTGFCWCCWVLIVETHSSLTHRESPLLDGPERLVLSCLVFLFSCMVTLLTRIRLTEDSFA